MLDWQEEGRHQRRMGEVLELIFVSHPRLLELLFYRDRARLRQPPMVLLGLANGLSTEERVLIRVALDLWCSSGQVQLWDIVERLDDDSYHSVLAGLRHLRQIEPGKAPMVWRQLKMAR